MKSYLSLRSCLGIDQVDRRYYDALGDAGLPSISSVYGNLNYPTSVNDIGGSAATKADSLNTGVNDAFSTYKNYAGTLPDTLSTYNQLEQQQGIPQLRATSQNLQGGINELENAIYRVTPNVSANTSNSLVTDSQRQGMIAAQELPMQQALTPQMTALGNVNAAITTGESGITGQINALNTSNAQKLGVAGMGVTVAQDNAARTMTGFTTDQENTMKMLMDKLAAQQHLDDQEWDTLSKLAENKQGYQNELDKIKQQQVYSQPLTPGQTIINTKTGVPYTAPLPA